MPAGANFSPEQHAQLGALQRPDRERAKGIAKRFAALPDVPGSHEALTVLSKEEAFPLEKQSLPAIWRSAAPDPIDVLFATIGNTPLPVILVIVALRPRAVYLFHTDSSRRQVRDVEDDADVASAGIEVIARSISEFEVAANYRVIDRALADARRRFGEGIAVTADPTGGTKMMVASLATWAFYRRMPLTYLYCPAKQGVAVPFAGRIERIGNPYVTFADIDLDQIRRFAEVGVYDAARQLCESVMRVAADPETAIRLELIREWLAICEQWDAFAHSDPDPRSRPDLAARLEGLIARISQYGYRDDDRDQRRANLEFLQSMPSHPEGAADMSDLHRLADLWAQADRRLRQGRYDDASARLYRLTEMALAIRLKCDFGLASTSHPDWAAVEKRTRVSFDELGVRVRGFPPERGEPAVRLPCRQLGLASSAAVLAAFDASFAKHGYRMVRSELKEGGTLHRRNRSTLAHGTWPLTKEEYTRFAGKASRMLALVLSANQAAEYERLRRMAAHALPPCFGQISA